jgi:hypothetical protein
VGTNITITEGAVPNFELVSIGIVPAGAGTGSVPTRSATVTIGAGNTVVTFTNTRPVVLYPLQVCKVGGMGITAGAPFTFTTTLTGATPFTANAGTAGAPGCVTIGSYPAGTAATITEGVVANTAVSSIAFGGPVTGTSFNLAARTATLTTGAGNSTVTFTNVALGTLKVCKIAGTGIALGTNFTFTLGATPVTVPAGSAGQGGACVILPNTYAAGTVVRVTETGPLAGTAVSLIAVNPAARGGTPNLADRYVDVTIGAGETAVTFTNVVPATVRVCKIGENPGAIGQTFSFTSNFSAPFTLVAAAAPGNCTTPVAVAIGSTATATEAARIGYIVFGNQYTLSTSIVAGLNNTITFRNWAALRACPRTQGFWGTHGPNSPGNQADEVTAALTFGRLTGSPLVTASGALALRVGATNYTPTQIDAIFDQPTKGDAEIILLHQLLAAQLNVLSMGVAATPDAVEDDIAAAVALLANGIADAEEGAAKTLAGRLDAFNNGAGVAGCPRN